MKYLIINVMVIRKRSSAWVLLWSVLIFFHDQAAQAKQYREPLQGTKRGVVLTKSTQHKPAARQSWKKQFDSHRHKLLLAPKTHRLQHTLIYIYVALYRCVLKTQSWWNSAGQFLLWFFGVHCSKMRKMAQQIFSTVFATLRKVWIQHITMVGVWNGVNLCSLHTS